MPRNGKEEQCIYFPKKQKERLSNIYSTYSLLTVHTCRLFNKCTHRCMMVHRMCRKMLEVISTQPLSLDNCIKTPNEDKLTNAYVRVKAWDKDRQMMYLTSGFSEETNMKVLTIRMEAPKPPICQVYSHCFINLKSHGFNMDNYFKGSIVHLNFKYLH